MGRCGTGPCPYVSYYCRCLFANLEHIATGINAGTGEHTENLDYFNSIAPFTVMNSDNWTYGLTNDCSKQSVRSVDDSSVPVYDVNRHRYGSSDIYAHRRQDRTIHDLFLEGSKEVCRTLRLNPDYYVRTHKQYPFLTAAISGGSMTNCQKDNSYCIGTRALDFSPVSYVVQVDPSSYTFCRMFPSYGRHSYSDNKYVIEQWSEKLFFCTSTDNVELSVRSFCCILPSLVGMLQEGRILSPVFYHAETMLKAKNFCRMGLETDFKWTDINKSVGWFKPSELNQFGPPPIVGDKNFQPKGLRGDLAFDYFSSNEDSKIAGFQFPKPTHANQTCNLFTTGAKIMDVKL